VTPTTAVVTSTAADATTTQESASSAPNDTSTTAAAIPTEEPAKGISKIAVSFSIDAKYEDVVKDKEEFIDNLKPQLATKLGVDPKQISNLDVKPGSIKVTFDVENDPDKPVNIQKSVQRMETDAKAGSLSFTAPDGSTLPVDSTSFETMTEKEDEGISDGALAGAIIGVILGFILLTVLLVVICKAINKKHGSIGKILPEDGNGDVEAGQTGYYRSLHTSPDNKGYEGEDEDDGPTYHQIEPAKLNNGNDYGNVTAPNLAPSTGGPPAEVSYEPPTVRAAAPEDGNLYETIPGQLPSRNSVIPRPKIVV